jgi:hypothetical protein
VTTYIGRVLKSHEGIVITIVVTWAILVSDVPVKENVSWFYLEEEEYNIPGRASIHDLHVQKLYRRSEGPQFYLVVVD